MAKKTPQSKAKSKSASKKFSVVALHNQLDKTLGRLNSRTKSAKRDQLIGLIKKMRSATFCPQDMLIDL